MFRNFIAWLDSYIAREEPSTVLKALVGLMAFAGLLGTIFGNQAIRAGAFATVIVFVVSTILLLLADRRRLQREHDVHRELLTRYCDLIIDDDVEPLISVTNWVQRLHVWPNGDVREVLTLDAVALREEVYFMRMPSGSEWDQPERYRRNVRIRARSIGENGASGPHWHVTTFWMSTALLKSIIHFRSPVLKGEAFRLEVERFWPAKCLPLMRHHAAENFVFHATERVRIHRMEYRVILPAGFDAVYEPIGFTDQHARTSVEAHTDNEGRKVIVCTATDLPIRKQLGMRLELA